MIYSNSGKREISLAFSGKYLFTTPSIMFLVTILRIFHSYFTLLNASIEYSIICVHTTWSLRDQQEFGCS